MSFQDTLDYMYNLLPMYQRVGKTAFKKDLTNTLKLCALLGHPQEKFKSIHVAGTNGKGSSAHMLASILQTAGYKTGLYTSPHLKSFTERIKIDGREVEESFVIEFIERLKHDIEEIQPSFFEITVAMAFDYFAGKQVDVAVIEVGLGGRFDSTNVIRPIISLITSIGLDHTDMLGETLPEIAFEKAGIIKDHVPVVISETQEEITDVFRAKAMEKKAPLYFADQEYQVNLTSCNAICQEFSISTTKEVAIFANTDLSGEYQLKNIPGVAKVVELMNKMKFPVDRQHFIDGMGHVVKNTGLLGRWQKLGEHPLTICDTVHNEAGVKYLVGQIEKMTFRDLFVIWGMVKEKDPEGIFRCLPKHAFYYFCEASVPRAMSAEKLMKFASESGMEGQVVRNVNDAIATARSRAKEDDLIIIGGSNFIIAEINDLKL
ncbi:MAG: bifunctional folylpolyglutamate synthase/dihydrofolate synthase [Cytophagales bacterium]|nr:bifunctional folylpolyglutamate synthase/dihydrofolate synthase [Cytophagales bacterium]